MAENTKIEWADHTFNPWEGCQKVGPGCDHCYAEARNVRFTGGTNWGPGAPRRRTSAANWTLPLRWNREAAARGTRPRVFCASLADVFDNAVDPAWRADLWALIAATPNLIWMLLTKRPGNIAKMLPADWGTGWPNVWLGCTVVNQMEADRDADTLRKIPAKVHFLSIEPMLGPISLEGYLHRTSGQCDIVDDNGKPIGPDLPDWTAIQWVICGGESGSNARPMHPAWARQLRDECRAFQVPFLFKQWGEWGPSSPEESIGNPRSGWRCFRGHPHIAKAAELYPEAGAAFIEYKGKKAAGRLLDGREWNEVPG